MKLRSLIEKKIIVHVDVQLKNVKGIYQVHTLKVIGDAYAITNCYCSCYPSLYLVDQVELIMENYKWKVCTYDGI